MTHVGPTIRGLRQELGLSARQLAEASGASHSYLCKVERGEKVPTDRWLRDINEALASRMLDLRRAS